MSQIYEIIAQINDQDRLLDSKEDHEDGYEFEPEFVRENVRFLEHTLVH